MQKRTLPFSIALALGTIAAQVAAQGNSLQGATPPQPTLSSPSAVPPVPAATPAARPAVPPGAATVVLRSVEISGNRAIDKSTLLAEIGDVSGQSLDMSALSALAQKLELLYRRSGYVFASVVLPPQDLRAGVLKISVIEGQYGRVQAKSEEASLAVGAQPFLDWKLLTGDVIQNAHLERVLLLLDDQPGMRVRPVIRPGEQAGQADLLVDVAHDDPMSGEVSLDNLGARSTGEYRLRGSVNFNSPFVFGDRVAVNGLVTNEKMWLGSVDYERPIGPSGLRGQVGYAHTNYQLAAQFADLDARGLSKTTSIRLTYPVVRSQASNLTLFAGAQHKELRDEYRAVGTKQTKDSNTFPFGVQFDNRDRLLGGGLTYGSFAWTHGKLDLDASASALDAASARSEGRFDKITLDLARIQQLSNGFSAYVRYSGQWAKKNLDSSEKFNLGGYYGVRAFPLGEGVGDEGWLTQLELRYQAGPSTVFVFHDVGKSNASAKAWDESSSATRTIAGSGIGVRSIFGDWSVDGSVAWRTKGGPSTADTRDQHPRLFFIAGRRF